jgi:hypothetical protein
MSSTRVIIDSVSGELSIEFIYQNILCLLGYKRHMLMKIISQKTVDFFSREQQN